MWITYVSRFLKQRATVSNSYSVLFSNPIFLRLIIIMSIFTEKQRESDLQRWFDMETHGT